MKFDTGWREIGKHRIRLRSAKGFLTEVMHQLAEVTRTAVDNNMSARARVVDIVFGQEKTYHIAVGSTVAEDRICAPQREPALAAATDLVPDQINLIVRIKAQEEVEPHFAVYERMHTACPRAPYDRLKLAAKFYSRALHA
ncbi:hypothetical protein CBA19CS11_30905 [Caballeronia novacaledonica]|uniref:hypothetical protein n=1 Tax=Caballeronia novacaledonica TaxID=1544861 RepID=UPI0007C7AB5D|nr:hypothetical protein [Caballeronia novacaledonica]GJH13341.1 hypothetical protein CBA19CS11_30905 [Caballeronia novacaledonica]